MRDSVLYNYGDKEKIAELCKKMIETDPEAREEYGQYLKDTASEDDEDVDWLLLLEELVDDPYETMASLYDYRIELPSRNKKYERSFFEDGDIQEYLVCEQIKKHDRSIGEYIKQFTFKDEQLMKFLKTAEKSNFTDLSVLMP